MPFFKKTAHNRCSVALCAVLVPILTFSLGANLVTLGCERVLLLYPALFEYRRLSARIHAVLLRKPGERGCRVGSAAAAGRGMHDGTGHLPDGRLRAADAFDAVSVRKWRWTGPLDRSAGRRRGDLLALYGSRGRPAKRKADAICSICWF